MAIRVLRESEIDDVEYQEFIKKCQKSTAYQQIKKICSKYGYRISETIYVDKRDQVRYFNISSDSRTAPRFYYDEALEVHTINTAGFNKMTPDEFDDLIKTYQDASKMLKELSQVDLTKLYHSN